MPKWAWSCLTPLYVQVVFSLVRLFRLMKSYTPQCSAGGRAESYLPLGTIPRRSPGIVLPGTRPAGSRDSLAWELAL